MEDNKFTWVPIFNKIAIKLEDFRYDRKKLIDIMYEILEELNLFNSEDEQNCNLDKYQGQRCKYDDFDPFSFMNRLALYGFDNRKKFIQKFEEKTNMPIEIPDDFDGIPSVNPKLSCMLTFKDERKEGDVDDYWNLFEAALKYPNDERYKDKFIQYYDKCISKPYCGFNLSSCLFRMNGNYYISLDSVNRNYIKSIYDIDIKTYPSGSEYLELLNQLKELVASDEKFDSLIDFSYKAWLSSKTNEEIEEKSDTTNSGENINYYFVSASPYMWSFTDINVGETVEYTSISENGNKRYIPRNYVNIKVGDKVIAYVSTPIKAIVGLCEVVSKDNDNNITLKKTEQLIKPIPYSYFKNAEELKNMEFIKMSNGSLFKLEKEEYNYLYDTIREFNPRINRTYDEYTEKKFLDDIYIDPKKYKEIVTLLNIRKKNIILQGSPGVGKTYMAKRLAYSIMGEENEDRIEFVQFHQSYSYEDFVEGFRPDPDKDGKYKIEKGIFYNFCIKAKNDPNNKYYMIIDEINRGRISKIFGELLTLIEEDKRDSKESVTLSYSKEKFFVPKNLYIIGMMNTADRGLAILDYALRRRFSFVDILPAFDNEKFINYKKSVNNNKLNKTIDVIKQLNNEIKEDPSLGKGFMIGHSYFCNLDSSCKNEIVESIVKYDIIPLIKEYWFDDENKVEKWKKRLLGE